VFSTSLITTQAKAWGTQTTTGINTRNYKKREAVDADESSSLNTALELIQKTLFSSVEGNEIINKDDEINQIKESAVKTVSIFNPNLSDKTIKHSFLYLGALVFFSFSSIFGALAPLSMQARNSDEPHNHIPGATFQI